jgi:hypothetical protein
MIVESDLIKTNQTQTTNIVIVIEPIEKIEILFICTIDFVDPCFEFDLKQREAVRDINTVPYRLVSVRDGIGKQEVGRDGTVRYAVLDRYTALPCCRKKNSLLTMIFGDIYLISLFALDANRNPTKITRINYLSISCFRLFHFNFF